MAINRHRMARRPTSHLWGEGAVVSTCIPTHQLAGMVETNRRPNVGDRWTRIAVRAVWRVAAIPGSGRGGRAEPYILI